MVNGSPGGRSIITSHRFHRQQEQMTFKDDSSYQALESIQ